jgi:hypothetical protein
MDRDGLRKVEVSDDFKVGLFSKGTKNGAERFVFVIQSDGSPTVVDPDAQPDQAEKGNAGKEEFWSIHEGLEIILQRKKGLGSWIQVKSCSQGWHRGWKGGLPTLVGFS